MSELKVNKISPQSGTAFTLGDSGDTFTVPSGATLTVSGTLTQTGAQTFDGGVEIDNFTINGSEIDLSSGDMTLDVAGDIILDADGGEVLFHDATTAMGHISMDSSNITLKSLVSDKDIIFQGNDGGAGITALTLDMSAAGKATFNDGVVATTVVGSGAAQFATAGIGAAKDLGAGLHIRTADSGASVNANADELVIEGSANSGISILSGNSSNGRIMFGDDGDNDIGYIEYDHSANQLALGANAASHLKIDSAGHVTMPLQSAIHVKPSTSQQDVAVNAGVTIVFGTEVFDRNGDFASNTFTAPVTGLYQVNVTLEIENTDGAGDTYFAIDVIASNRTQRTTIDYNSIQNDSTIRSCTGSVLMDMDASDTITIQWYQSNGTAQADISAQSSLSIFLAC